MFRYDNAPHHRELPTFPHHKHVQFGAGRHVVQNITCTDSGDDGIQFLANSNNRATGKWLSRFAEENIFKPLGMTHTRFYDDHSVIVPGRVSAYAPREGGDGPFGKRGPLRRPELLEQAGLDHMDTENASRTSSSALAARTA